MLQHQVLDNNKLLQHKAEAVFSVELVECLVEVDNSRLFNNNHKVEVCNQLHNH